MSLSVPEAVFCTGIDWAAETHAACVLDRAGKAVARPYHAAEHGLVDEIIDPADTRPVLIRALAMLRARDAQLPVRKHGNPPA